jgi:hypothetical protein
MGMKASTIKIVIKKKLDNWLETITDETLAHHIRKDVIVSGGAIASMLLGEQPNDYDIYFRTFETTKKVAEYYSHVFKASTELNAKSGIPSVAPEVQVKKIQNIKGEIEERVVFYMKSSGVASEHQAEYDYFENKPEEAADVFMDSLSKSETLVEDLVEEVKSKKPKYRPIFFSDNAVTLSDKVQLIIRFYGEPAEILKNYDFVHSMCYYDYSKGDLVYHPEALESLLSKSLIYRGSLYPIASLFRIRKFIARGWRITAGQMLKMVWQIKEIDLNDKDVLREQLIGVDQAYMSQLLRALETKEGRIDATYIMKLIDEIFDED